jgi:type VI secretion system ImpC/EvpB family protein
LESFDELERTSDLARHFEQLDYLQWRRLRDSEDSRFLGLVLPRILLRVPYEDDGTRLDGFGFREEVEERGRRRYLWGNAAYAFGAVVVRAFAERGWLANIRGVQRDPKLGVVGGGLVTGLPVHSFQTDKQGIAVKCSMDAVITDYQEKNLAELGFLPLCHCADTPQAAFYSSMSVQKPKRYDEPAATASARLSAMLNCLFCASRFAHYLKGMVRDKIGKYIGPAECEADLQSWLLQYTTATADEDPESAIKARHPLREARVQIREDLYIPGKYHCVIHLRPYFQLDQVVTTLKLTTELAPGMTG